MINSAFTVCSFCVCKVLKSDKMRKEVTQSKTKYVYSTKF